MKQPCDSEEATKHKFIKLIAQASDRYGNPHLLGLMDECGSHNLMRITAKQAEDYYYSHISKER